MSSERSQSCARCVFVSFDLANSSAGEYTTSQAIEVYLASADVRGNCERMSRRQQISLSIAECDSYQSRH